jgi:hypothetical protein
LEALLLKLCADLKLQISVGPWDRGRLGEGIERAKTLLREAKGYRIGEAEYWQELKQIQKIRNLVVHQGERLPTYYSNPDGDFIEFSREGEMTIYIAIEKTVYDYLSKHDLIQVSGASVEIVPGIAYCNYLVGFAKNMFSKLYHDLQQK